MFIFMASVYQCTRVNCGTPIIFQVGREGPIKTVGVLI